MSSANVASRLNDIIAIYEPYIDNHQFLTFDSEWMDYFDNLDELIPEIRKIPVQNGNDGTVSPKEETSSLPVPAQPSQVAPTYQHPTPYAPQPYMQPYMQPAQPMVQQKPELKQTKRGLDFKSVLQTNPSLAYAPNPLMPAIQQQRLMEQQQMMANRQPSWAGNQQPQQYYQQGMAAMQQTAPSWAGGQSFLNQGYPNQTYMQQPVYGV